MIAQVIEKCGRGARSRSGTRWSRSGTARSGPTNGPQTRHRTATPAGMSPEPGPRPPRPSPASGNSAPATRPRNWPVTLVKSSLTVIACPKLARANASDALTLHIQTRRPAQNRRAPRPDARLAPRRQAPVMIATPDTRLTPRHRLRGVSPTPPLHLGLDPLTRPAQPSPQEPGSDTDHPGIKRPARARAGGRSTSRRSRLDCHAPPLRRRLPAGSSPHVQSRPVRLALKGAASPAGLLWAGLCSAGVGLAAAAGA